MSTSDNTFEASPQEPALVEVGEVAYKSPDALYQYFIDNGLNQNWADILKSNEIDEQSAYDLNSADFEKMGINLIGPQKTILRLIRKLKNDGSNDDNLSIMETMLSISEDNKNDVLEGSEFGPSYCYNAYIDDSRDLHTVLMASGTDGRTLLDKYHSTGQFTTRDNATFVRILVDDLVDQCSHYPKAVEMENLARAILRTFPKLCSTKDATDNPYVDYYATYHNARNKARICGHIPNRVTHLQRSLPPSQKKYRPRRNKVKSSNAQSEEPASVAKQMKQMASTAENEGQIRQLMESTYSYRQELVRSGSTLSSIFEAFPHYLNYEGKMISDDFNTRYPGLEGNIEILKEIIKIPDARAVANMDADLQRIYDLMKAVPNSNIKKIFISEEYNKEQIKSIVEWIGANDDLTVYLEKADQKTMKLLAKGVYPTPNTLYLRVEREVIPLKNAWIYGLDMLFKAYFVFDLKYPGAAKSFFNFIETKVYQMKHSKPHQVCKKAYEYFSTH